jgi:hypothetical protein
MRNVITADDLSAADSYGRSVVVEFGGLCVDLICCGVPTRKGMYGEGSLTESYWPY